MKRCKKCLLPETYPGIYFINGICSYCLGKTQFGIEKNKKIQILIKNKKNLKKEFEDFVKKTRGKTDYDCLLLFSGGKDSTYLLFLLKKWGLKILTLSVDTGLMNSLAKENIKKVIEKINVDHIFFTPGNNFFKKFYRYYLLNSYAESYCDKICRECSNIIHGIGLIEASKRQIPYILIANSPDQTDDHYFEISQERISQSWIPEEFKNKYFSKEELRYFWNPKKGDYLPRFFLPFHVIDYPGEKAVIEKVSKLFSIKKNKLNPIKTNCHLAWLMTYIDLKNKGYIPYIKNISRQIQSGKYHLNKTQKMYHLLGTQLIKLNLVKREEKDYALKYLDLKIKDLKII